MKIYDKIKTSKFSGGLFMNRLMDKIILFIIIVLFVSTEKSLIMPVVAFLTALIFSVISQCYCNTKLSTFLHMGYAFLCLINPFFCLTFPLVSYEIFREKKIPVMVISALCVFSQLNYFHILQIVFIISVVFISSVLEYKTSVCENLRQKYIESSDNSRETELALQEKNKELCENQDMEIHLATLQERNRIAREIHDNVGHMLTRTILQVGALKVINKDKAVGEGLESVKNTLDEAMTSVRKSVHDLHDESVDLRQNLEELLKTCEVKFQVTKNFDFSDVIPKNVKYAIIGIVKESLNNAVKYSNGDRILLSVQEHPAFYQLVIEDNGTNSEIKSENGMGLENMRERVKNLGGIISITTNEKYFRIFASIPKEKNV